MTRYIPISRPRIHFRPTMGFSAQEDMNEHTSHSLSLTCLTSKYSKQALLTKDLLSLLLELDPLSSKTCLMTINPTNRLNMGHPIFTAGWRQKRRIKYKQQETRERKTKKKFYGKHLNFTLINKLLINLHARMSFSVSLWL